MTGLASTIEKLFLHFTFLFVLCATIRPMLDLTPAGF